MDQAWGTIIYILALFAILYFFLIRPQTQRQKKHQEMLRNLKVNDYVLTAGGILGHVVKIKEDTVVVRIADNVRVEMVKQAIVEVRESPEEEE